MAFRAPGFYNIEEFADMMGTTPDHMRHAAKNFTGRGTRGSSRAKLPEGYGAFIWSGVYIIFDLRDEKSVERMFNVKIERA